MKTLTLTLLFSLSSVSHSYPGFSDKKSPCALNYYDFCSSIDPTIQNMCPEEVTEDSKENCLVTELNKQVIEKVCAGDIEKVCQNKKTFKENYLCLVHPKNWGSMDMKCLRSLSGGLHGGGKPQKI